jgi:hypothetical protein
MTYSHRAAVALIGSALILAIACCFLAKNLADGPPPGGDPPERLGVSDSGRVVDPVLEEEGVGEG